MGRERARVKMCCTLKHGIRVVFLILGVSASLRAGNLGWGSPWISADYLMWWTDAAHTPALVTTSPASTLQADAGVLGHPNTRVALGGSVNDEMRSGYRVRGGWWSDPLRSHGFEFHFLQLETLSDAYQRRSSGDPILARPFTDANRGTQVAELIAFGSLVSGSLDAAVVSQGLLGWGANYRANLVCCAPAGRGGCRQNRLDVLIGYRGLRLDDGVQIREELSSPLFVDGTLFRLEDVFEADNEFHGCNLGVVFQRRRCRWSLDAVANIGLGATRSDLRIDGRTTITSPGGPRVQHRGGLLALSSNIGESGDTDFTAVFDVGLNLVCRLTSCLTAHVGYTFLFWPDVYRAAEQIDVVVNPNLLPPPILVPGQPQRPRRLLRESDWWAQGIQFGFEYRF
jgi:hypothetical protein